MVKQFLESEIVSCDDVIAEQVISQEIVTARPIPKCKCCGARAVIVCQHKQNGNSAFVAACLGCGRKTNQEAEIEAARKRWDYIQSLVPKKSAERDI